MDKQSKEEMLWKIYENLVRTEERLRALVEVNTSEHNDIKEDILSAYKKQEELEKRIEKLENQKVALSTTSAIIIFLLGLIPTIILVLQIIGII